MNTGTYEVRFLWIDTSVGKMTIVVLSISDYNFQVYSSILIIFFLRVRIWLKLGINQFIAVYIIRPQIYSTLQTMIW